MAYIGKTPITGNFVKLDAISVVNGQAGYTMNNGGSAFTDYENVNQFLVSLNGILQAPTDSFTVSGSTLTFASNLATGDVIDFVIVLGNTLDIGTPSDNTVSLAKLTATGTKDATTFLRGDNTFASAGGTNTPNFLALPSADQDISNTTNTAVVLDTEVFDSDNAFASNTFTVPSGKAGKYLFIAQGRITNLNSNKEFQLSFFKNGSSDFSEASQNAYIVQNTYSPDSSASMYFSHSMIANLAESDAITIYVYHNAGASKTLESTYTRFSGFKLVE